MEMLRYISEIQKKLITQYGFAERPDAPGVPAHVPDGAYPMKIKGRMDHVKVKDGKISCCNFAK